MQYYVRTKSTSGDDDTLKTRISENPDSSFHIITEKIVYSSLGTFNIKKFTNEPDAGMDGGVEMFYEANLGMFYARSLGWKEYTRLHTNDDSLNNIISILVDRVLADPEFCNFPVLDTTEVIKFTTPKFYE